MKLSREYLESLALPAIVERGEQYYQRDRVVRIRTVAQGIEAEVAGSQTYQQFIDLESDEWRATCTCPYEGEGICKHLVAVGLAWLEGVQIKNKNESESIAAFRVDPDWIKDRIHATSIEELPGVLAAYQKDLSETHTAQEWMDAIRMLMGFYEGILIKGDHLVASYKNGFEHLVLQLVSIGSDIRLEVPAAKTGIEWIFSKWSMYEAKHSGRGGKAHSFEISEWQEVLMALIRDPISAHFTTMKLQAYGLSEAAMPHLCAHIQQFHF